MEFWNSLLTEKSREVLQQLKKEDFRFVVIEEWAAYLWTKQHKSKDIDMILPEINDLALLKEKYPLAKNEHLKKYEVKFAEIDLEIYVPYYSNLALPIEAIIKRTTQIERFEVVSPEVLLILKQGAEIDRSESIKGQKDKIDILTLLCFAPVSFPIYNELLKKHHLEHYKPRLKTIIQHFKDLKYLNLNFKDYNKIKKELLEKVWVYFS